MKVALGLFWLQLNVFAIVYLIAGGRALLWFACGMVGMAVSTMIAGFALKWARPPRELDTSAKIAALRSLVKKGEDPRAPGA